MRMPPGTTQPGEGWWTGRCSTTGRVGIFPANYVRPAPGGTAEAEGSQHDAAHSSGADSAAKEAVAAEAVASASVLDQMDLGATDAASPAEALPAAALDAIAGAAASLQQLRAILDSRVVGQMQVKEGILLALMTREHIYLEGPPGTCT